MKKYNYKTIPDLLLNEEWQIKTNIIETNFKNVRDQICHTFETLEKQFCSKNNFKLTSNGGERNYFAQVENFPNIKIIYLHAKEIIQRLGDNTLDVGISGLDLLNESPTNLKKKIEIKKKLDFGFANVVVAIPDDWIDVQTIADLEEVSFDFRDKKKH